MEWFTHIYLNENTESGFMPALKIAVTLLKEMLRSGKTISMLIWDYSANRWKLSPPITIFGGRDAEYIACADASYPIRLENLIDMNFVIVPKTLLHQPLVRHRERRCS